MRQMRPAGSPMRGLGLMACLAVVLLAAATPAFAQQEQHPPPAPVPVADDDLTGALESGELTEAEYALERARSVFQLGRVRSEFGHVVRPAAHDTTLILRDLAVRLGELTGSDRAAAARILARPDAGPVPIGNGWDAPESVSSPICGTNVCVHWVDEPGNDDAPADADSNPGNGIPDWVDLALSTLDTVWLEQIDTLGYREPLSDLGSSNNGGGKKLDVYIDDLGTDGVFGYCTSDDPTRNHQDVYAVSAYCVVDNDFAPSQFGDEQTPQEYLEVTVAHEFHHAVQFAYDWLEDHWLMEGTAANIEETVYPDVDDNVNFLISWSPLSRPTSPLDRGGFGNSEYGAWIFWRYLEEKIGGDPSILREIWERADASVPDVSPDDDSLEAVRHELTERGLAFADVFASFATANRFLDYADAGNAGYPSVPLTETYKVGRETPLTPWQAWTINHLAARFFTFRPGQPVSADARLRVLARLPENGARARLIVVESDGSTSTRTLVPNANGLAQQSARFGPGDVKRVDVVFTNGSTRTKCWTAEGPPFYSCLGDPRDDGGVLELRGKLIDG
jgi:hypothetical protein